jgi:asparagine synthase (glutamine-hydrolysing)
LLKKLYPYIFDSQSEKPNAFLIGFFRKGLEQVASPVYSHLIRWQNTSQLKNFFQEGILPVESNLDSFIDRIVSQLPEAFDGWSSLAKAQYLESKLFLSSYLLSSQGDRMAMANSIEGRFPFLDHRVVELAARMPPDLRLNGLTEKYILKQVAKNNVPAELVDRPKQPYRAPISRCFLGPRSPEYVNELLSVSALQNTGYFHPAKVRRLADKCRKQEGRLMSERENMALVAILSTQLLDHQFVRNFPTFSDSSMEHTVMERQEN